MSTGKKNWISKLPSAFSKLPHSVSRSAFLDSYEKNIWCYLSTHTDRFHPSEALIARHTGITAKAVRNIIDRLIKKNVIEITNLPRSTGKKKEYRLIEPELWNTEQVPKTSFVDKEQAPKTCLIDSKQALRTAYPRSLEPVIVDKKKNNIIEEQPIDSGELNKEEESIDVNSKFKEEVLEVLTENNIIFVIEPLCELVRDYTSVNGASPPELKWLQRKLSIWFHQKNLPEERRVRISLRIIEFSDRGIRMYREKLDQA